MKDLRMPDVRVTYPNVTPLIDVVMCMIIFYMLVARIGVKTGADEKIDLPESFQGVELKDPGNAVTLNVSAAGDQPLVTALNRRGELEEVKIVEGTRRPLRAVLREYKGSNEDFKIIIRADQNLDYWYLEPVLLTCAEVQPRSVNFATRMPVISEPSPGR